MKTYLCSVAIPDGNLHFVKNDKKSAIDATKNAVEQNYGKVEFAHGTIVEEENGDVWAVTINEQTGKARVIKTY